MIHIHDAHIYRPYVIVQVDQSEYYNKKPISKYG